MKKTIAKSAKVKLAKSKPLSRITSAVYESAKDLYAAGAIDKATMREFDIACLPPVPKFSASQIRALRARYKCSQPVFAAYLNVTPSSLKQWETGAKRPAGAACKLLDLIERKGLDALA